MVREIPPSGILQEWVAKLGLRHQGVLVSIIRGCDTLPKYHPLKTLTRIIRGHLLNTHCSDPSQAKSYIKVCCVDELKTVMGQAAKHGFDELPHHFVMHLIHACSIIGFKHPDVPVGLAYEDFYHTCCRKLHVNPETEGQLDRRLNADEETFAKGQ